MDKREKKHRWMYKNLPRWINQIYAFLNGYFWLPCECGRYFGGHEWFSTNEVYDGNGSGHGVCPKCGEENKEEIIIRSKENSLKDNIKIYE